jgi:acyl-lipid omega-6 desaturase (Delta-12 desaturase)
MSRPESDLRYLPQMRVAEPLILERELRTNLRPLRIKRTSQALLIFVLDLSLYAIFTWRAMASASLAVRLVSGLLAGVSIAMLFVVGHDACHGSFTRSRRLNQWLGRMAFLTSLTPFRTWELGHNQTHHVYTNLKPLDYVWMPFSKTEFDRLPGWRRALERCYRTPAGVGLYYAVEIWWRRLFFPRGQRCLADCSLCALYGLVLSVVGLSLGWRAWLAGVLWPLLCWNWAMGWAIFEHHTHPRVRWFDDVRAWRAAGAQLSCTVHAVLPRPFDMLLHYIMQHTAHHLDVTIPLYNLRQAQSLLEAESAQLVVYRWTPFTFFRHLRVCKLYDFERQRWLRFDGKSQ